MNRNELIKELKSYILEYVEVEKYKGKKLLNGCDMNEVFNDLEVDVVKSFEEENKLEVYW